MEPGVRVPWEAEDPGGGRIKGSAQRGSLPRPPVLQKVSKAAEGAHYVRHGFQPAAPARSHHRCGVRARGRRGVRAPPEEAEAARPRARASRRDKLPALPGSSRRRARRAAGRAVFDVKTAPSISRRLLHVRGECNFSRLRCAHVRTLVFYQCGSAGNTKEGGCI